MKNLLLLSLLLTYTVISSQIKIDNELTEKHQLIKGTKVSLVSPEDFIEATNFGGFQQNETGSSIMVLPIPGGYQKVRQGITEGSLLAKGIVTKKIEEVDLNGTPGILVSGEQNAYGNTYQKYILVFGYDKETIMINGVSPKNFQGLSDTILKSMKSVIYNPGLKVDPLKNVDFEVDIKKTGLVFASSVANSLVFNRDGRMPSESEDKLSLMIAKSFSETTIEDRKLFTLNRIKQLFEVESINSTSAITVDGISGYEIVADTKDRKSGEELKTYLSILYSDKLYYIFLGSSIRNYDNNINLLKKTVRTFTRK